MSLAGRRVLGALRNKVFLLLFLQKKKCLLSVRAGAGERWDGAGGFGVRVGRGVVGFGEWAAEGFGGCGGEGLEDGFDLGGLEVRGVEEG